MVEPIGAAIGGRLARVLTAKGQSAACRYRRADRSRRRGGTARRRRRRQRQSKAAATRAYFSGPASRPVAHKGEHGQRAQRVTVDGPELWRGDDRPKPGGKSFRAPLMQPPETLRLRIAAIGERIRQRGGRARRCRLRPAHRGPDRRWARKNRAARVKGGDQRADEGGDAENAKTSRRAEPEPGPAQGDEEAGDDARPGQGRARSVSMTQRALREQGQPARPRLAPCPPGGSATEFRQPDGSCFTLPRLAFETDDFAPNRGFMSTTAEFCRGRSRRRNRRRGRMTACLSPSTRTSGIEQAGIIGSGLDRAIGAGRHDRQQVARPRLGHIAGCAPENRRFRRPGRRDRP